MSSTIIAECSGSLNDDIRDISEKRILHGCWESINEDRYSQALSESAFLNDQEPENVSHTDQLSTVGRNSSVMAILSSNSTGAVAMRSDRSRCSSKFTGSSSSTSLHDPSLMISLASLRSLGVLTPTISNLLPGTSLDENAA